MNPVKSIWLSPRQTTQFLLDRKNEREALIVIVAACCFLSLAQYLFDFLMFWVFAPPFAPRSLPTFPVGRMILMSFVIAPILAWVFFRLFPVVLHRFGLWFGGRATEEELRIVVGWASLPVCVAIVLGKTPMLAYIAAEPHSGNESLAMIVSAANALMILAGLIVATHMIAVTERLSAWRTAGALCFSSLLPIVLFLFFRFWLGLLLK